MKKDGNGEGWRIVENGGCVEARGVENGGGLGNGGELKEGGMGESRRR